MTKDFYNVFFRFLIPHTCIRDAAVTKTTDPFSHYTCVMPDYAPLQKHAHYVMYVPLCAQHIVFDTKQFRAISVIITEYPKHTESTLFYPAYKISF